MRDRQWFVLYVLVCLEVGIFLILVPWSAIWERNYFLQVYPLLKPVLLAPAFRGAVSGLGVANVFIVLRDVVGHRGRTTSSQIGLFPGGVHLSTKPGSRPDRSERSAASPGSSTKSRALVAQEKRS